LRLAAVRVDEHRRADLGPDACSFLGAYRRIPSLAVLCVVGHEGLRDADAEGRSGVVDRESFAEGDGRLDVGAAGALLGEALLDGRRVRMDAQPVERLHLRRRDTLPGCHSESLESRAHPPAGRLALLVVVVREARVALLGGVVRGDLAGEVAVPVTRGQLPQTHHDAFKRGTPGEWTVAAGAIKPADHVRAKGVWLWSSAGR